MQYVWMPPLMNSLTLDFFIFLIFLEKVLKEHSEPYVEWVVYQTLCCSTTEVRYLFCLTWVCTFDSITESRKSQLQLFRIHVDRLILPG